MVGFPYSRRAMNKYISDCCGAPVRFEGGMVDFIGDEKPITMHAICTKCGRPCNFKKKETKMSYIKKLGEKEINGFEAELWDFSRCNEDENARIECIARIASICYNKAPKDAAKLVKRLSTESGGLPSSAFEFIRDGGISGIDSSLRNNPGLSTHESYIGSLEYPYTMILRQAQAHFTNIATFNLKVPIFLARQIQRHRSFSYQELSRRYTTDKQSPIEFWYPQNIGSDYKLICESALKNQKVSIKNGMRPEVARAILPQATYTKFWMQGDIPAWSNYFKLRLEEHTQKEHRQLASIMADLIKEHQPQLWGKIAEEAEDE